MFASLLTGTIEEDNLLEDILIDLVILERNWLANILEEIIVFQLFGDNEDISSR